MMFVWKDSPTACGSELTAIGLSRAALPSCGRRSLNVDVN